MYVLVTVPHAHCVTKIVRACDLRALECANKLGNLLKKKDIRYNIVKLSISRLDVDLNRKQPDNNEAIKYWTLFNNKIIKKIALNKNSNISLFDIHSFPKGEFDNSQIALIDLKNQNRKELILFANYIIDKYGCNVKIFNGDENNFIQETYKNKTYPILIEFCEDKNYLLDEVITKFLEELITYFT
jgi:hypothetical protein